MKKILTLSFLALAIVAGASAQESAPTRASVAADVDYGMGNTIETSRYRASLDIGYTYRTAKAAAPDLDEVNWRSGISYGMTFHWMFKFGLGVGTNFTGQHYKCTYKSRDSNMNSLFLGPSAIYRLYFTKARRMAFVAGLSAGYLHYHERLTEPSMVVSSGSLGVFSEAGLDFRIARGTYLGFTLNALSGSVALPGRSDVREDLGTFGIRAGVRF